MKNTAAHLTSEEQPSLSLVSIFFAEPPQILTTEQAMSKQSVG